MIFLRKLKIFISLLCIFIMSFQSLYCMNCSAVSTGGIESFALIIDGNRRNGLINDKTCEITVDVPYYVAGQGQVYSRPDVTKLKAEISTVGGTAAPASGGEYQDFTHPVVYTFTNSNGMTKNYIVRLEFSVLQFASGFENVEFTSGVLSDGYEGAASFISFGEGKAGSVSVKEVNGNKMLNMKKTNKGSELSFIAYDGGASQLTTDCKMEFDFKFDSISENTREMSWYMGGMHQIIPSYVSDTTYTLQYRCGITGRYYSIPNMQSFNCGQTYRLTYIFSRNVSDSDYEGKLYIDNHYVATLSNDFRGVPSKKLSPALALRGFYSGLYDVSFDNIEITYREDTENDVINLHIIGDSTCCEYQTSALQKGWGTYFDDYFGEGVRVTNHSVAEYSTGMLLGGGEPLRHDIPATWPLLKYNLHEGDFVMISLGWNERSSNNTFPVDIEGYKANLKTMISDIEAAGAMAILVTPTIRTDATPIVNDMDTWAEAMIGVAEESSSTFYIDLNSTLFDLFSKGDIESIRDTYYVGRKDGKTSPDYFHFNETGAKYVADTIKTLLEKSECNLKNYLCDRNLFIRIDDYETFMSGNEVVISVPIFDENGMFYDTSSIEFNITAETNDGTSAKLYSSSNDNIGTTISEKGTMLAYNDIDDGTKVVCGDEIYTICIERVFEDDFDNNSLFAGESVGKYDTTKKAATWDGNFTIKGTDAQKVVSKKGVGDAWYTAVGTSRIEANTTDEAKILAAENTSIGVKDISGAKAPNGDVMTNYGEAKASGNALKLSKKIVIPGNSQTGSIADAAVSYYVELTIGDLTNAQKQLPGLANADELVVEFDMAGDYWSDIPLTYKLPVAGGTLRTINNVVGGAYAGVKCLVSNSETCFATIAFPASTLLADVGDPTNTTLTVTGAGINMTSKEHIVAQWNHVKLVFKKNDSGMVDVWFKGLRADGRAGNDYEHKTLSAIPQQIQVLTRGRTATNLWVDNLSIRYK